jgi:hypothetical protein
MSDFPRVPAQKNKPFNVIFKFIFSDFDVIFFHIKNIDKVKKVKVDMTDKIKNITTTSIIIFPAPD